MSSVYCNICNIWFLDATFPNRWIGRDDPTPWPPRSPDITALDLARITDVFVTITEDMLENTWREFDYRLDVLRATKGAHVEVYWCVVKKTSWVTFWRKKHLYSTYSSFLVINVCKQGKTLCSPCATKMNTTYSANNNTLLKLRWKKSRWLVT